MQEIIYNKKGDVTDCVYYKNCTKSYPLHTHTKHVMAGTVEEGKVYVALMGEKKIYGKGEGFLIPPNTAHEIGPVDHKPYSMRVLCMCAESDLREDDMGILRSSMIEYPENKLLLDDMSKMANVSKYHMIREFKKTFGLTPHQFQIQCRVRKAQKLVEEQRSMTEISYDTGFCDESHLDRCFQKIVRLTPTEYRNAVKQAD